MKVLKYILTPIIVTLSIVLSMQIFVISFPFIIKCLVILRGGEDTFWSVFGRWGILFIATFLGAIVFPFYIIPLTLIGKMISKMSPNETYLKYSFIIIGTLYGLAVLYSLWTSIPLDIYEIVRLLILSIFMILIIIFLSIASFD